MSLLARSAEQGSISALDKFEPVPGKPNSGLAQRVAGPGFCVDAMFGEKDLRDTAITEAVATRVERA